MGTSIGVAYLLESEFGIELPKELQREFGPIANDEVDRLGREVSAAELKAMFWREYIDRTAPYMHDGRFATLEEVVEHYNGPMHRSATLDPNLAKHPEADEMGLDDLEAAAA